MLRYRYKEYCEQVFKGSQYKASNIDNLEDTVELFMKECGSKYINVFMYLSKVRDMLERAKSSYYCQEQYMKILTEQQQEPQNNAV